MGLKCSNVPTAPETCPTETRPTILQIDRANQLRDAGQTVHDAVIQASGEVMKERKGRKALIVLSDGVDFGSYGTLKDAVEAAQRAVEAFRSPRSGRMIALGLEEVG